MNHIIGFSDDRQPALRVVAERHHLNINGVVFGGWIMAQVDVAGSIPAYRRALGPVATRNFTSFDFRQPILEGDVVSFYADIIATGKTSITVRTCVYSERGVGDDYQVVKVTESTAVYVAINADGSARQLPPL